VSGVKYRIGSLPDSSHGTACTGTTTWTCTGTTGYASGANTLYVSAYDAAGNYTQTGNTITVNYTPAVPVFSGIMSGVLGSAIPACTPQTISFTQPSGMTVGDADQTLTYSSDSGLTVSLDTNNHSYCTIVSSKLHAVAASGTNGCTIQTTQAGNGTYCAATELDRSVTITAASGCTTMSYVNKNSAVGKAVTLTGVTSGHGIVVGLQWQDSNVTPTLSDGTNAPDGYSTIVTAYNEYIRIAYWLSSPKSGSVTYTWTAADGGGYTAHVFEISSDGTIVLDHKDAGATGLGNPLTSTSETSTSNPMVGIGLGGVYSTETYSSATLDGVAVDQETDIVDTGYFSFGAMTLRVMNNPGTYTSVINIIGTNAWVTDLIGFKCQ
jgi:hypothetical protein